MTNQEAVQADFPDWHIWRSRRADGELGMWMATRLVETAGEWPTLAESSAEELRAALLKQHASAQEGH